VLARAGLPRAASSTASTRRSVESIGDVLDLGSGAGAVALVVAPFARSVVATDVNPRAALFVSANAAAHGHTNLAVATGDLFAPVQGRRFDRILTQPPWVPDWSDGSGEGGPTYATSGPRGDLLTRRILREVSGYLTPRGLAVIVAQLPVSPDLPVEDDLTQGLPDDVDVIVGLGRADDYEYLAATCTAAELPRFGAAYDEEVVRRAHLLRARGIQAFTRAMIALRPTAQPGRAGVRARFELPSSPDAWIGSDDLERWLDAAVLRAPGADAALHVARLRLRPELQLARLPEGGALLHAPPACPITLAGVGPGTVRVLEALKATRTVGDALRKIAPQPAARAAILAGVRELLGAGVLEVVPG
jgi:SAM-dependent methyltransferase